MKKCLFVCLLIGSWLIGCSVSNEHRVVSPHSAAVSQDVALVARQSNSATDKNRDKPVIPILFPIDDRTASPGSKLIIRVKGVIPGNLKDSNLLSYNFSPDLKKLPGPPSFDATNNFLIWNIPGSQPMSSFKIEIVATYKNLRSKSVAFRVNVLKPGEAMIIRGDSPKPEKISDLKRAFKDGSFSRIVLYGGLYSESISIRFARDLIVDCIPDLSGKKPLLKGVHIENALGITLNGCDIDASGAKDSAISIEGAFGDGDSDDLVTLNHLDVHGADSSYSGITISGKPSVAIQSCHIFKNSTDGILAIFWPWDRLHFLHKRKFLITDSLIEENGANGIHLSVDALSSIIGSTIKNNGKDPNSKTGRYGILRDPPDRDKVESSPAMVTLSDTSLLNNSGAIAQRKSSQDIGNFPLIINAPDFPNKGDIGDSAITTSGTEGPGVTKFGSIPDSTTKNIEIFIVTRYPASKKYQAALRQVGGAYAKVIFTADDQNASIDATRQALDSVSCLKYVFGANGYKKEMIELLATIITTDQLMNAYIKAQNNFSGQTIPIDLNANLKNSCQFNVDSMN